MSAITHASARVPVVFTFESEAPAPTPEALYLEAIRSHGFSHPAFLPWEYGRDLQVLADLPTFTEVGAGQSNNGHGWKAQRLHCPRRVTVRMAARYALGLQALPPLPVDPITWKYEAWAKQYLE